MRRRPDLLAWQADSETLLFDHSGQRAHWLNTSASFIWERIEEPPQKVVTAVARAFGIDREEASAAVAATKTELRAKGLLGEPIAVAAKPEPRGGRFEPVPPNT